MGLQARGGGREGEEEEAADFAEAAASFEGGDEGKRSDAPPPPRADGASERFWAMHPQGVPVGALLGGEGEAAALSRRLRALDTSGDGYLSAAEFRQGLVAELKNEKRMRLLRRLLAGSAALLLLLVGLMTAMTFVVVDLSKDTEPSGGRLVDRDSGEALRTASEDFEPPGADGVLRPRGGNSSLAVAEARLPGPLTSALPNEAFSDLKTFRATSDSGAYVELVVTGWARLGADGVGDVVLVTPAGHVTVAGEELFFEDLVGNLFERAGFRTAAVPRRRLSAIAGGGRFGRRLAGFYELQAFFNSVSSWEGLGADEQKPTFPDKYVVNVTYYYRCDMRYKVRLMEAAESISGRLTGDTMTAAKKQALIDTLHPKRCTHFPGVEKHVRQLEDGKKYVAVNAQMTIDNERELAREVYFPRTITDDAVVRLKLANNSLNYQVHKGGANATVRAAIHAGTEERGLFCEEGDLDGALNPPPEEGEEGYKMLKRTRQLHAEQRAERKRALLSHPSFRALLSEDDMVDTYNKSVVCSGECAANMSSNAEISFRFVGPMNTRLNGQVGLTQVRVFQVIKDGRMALELWDTRAGDNGTYLPVRLTVVQGLDHVVISFGQFRLDVPDDELEAILTPPAECISSNRTTSENHAPAHQRVGTYRPFVGTDAVTKEALMNPEAAAEVRFAAFRAMYGDSVEDFVKRELQAGITLAELSAAAAEQMASSSEVLRAESEGSSRRMNLLGVDRRLLEGHEAGRRLLGADENMAMARDGAMALRSACIAAFEFGSPIPCLGIGQVEDAELCDAPNQWDFSWNAIPQVISIEIMLADNGLFNPDGSVDSLKGDAEEDGDAFMKHFTSVGTTAQDTPFARLCFAQLIVTATIPIPAIKETIGVEIRISYDVDPRFSFSALEKAVETGEFGQDLQFKIKGCVSPILVIFGKIKAIIVLIRDIVKLLCSIGKAISSAVQMAEMEERVAESKAGDAGGLGDTAGDMFTMFKNFQNTDCSGWDYLGNFGDCLGADLVSLICPSDDDADGGIIKTLDSIAETMESLQYIIPKLCLEAGIGSDKRKISDGSRYDQMYRDTGLLADIKELDLEKITCPSNFNTEPYASMTIDVNPKLDIYFMYVEFYAGVGWTYFFMQNIRCAKRLCAMQFGAMMDQVQALSDSIQVDEGIKKDLAAEVQRAKEQQAATQAEAEGMRVVADGALHVLKYLGIDAEQINPDMDADSIDWEGAGIDFYGMESWRFKATAIAARVGIQVIQAQMDDAGGIANSARACNPDEIDACLAAVAGLAIEAVALMQLINTETDCPRKGRDDAIFQNEQGLSGTGAAIATFLENIQWLPFTPDEIFDMIEWAIQGLMESFGVDRICNPPSIQPAPLEIGPVTLTFYTQLTLCVGVGPLKIARSKIFGLVNSIVDFGLIDQLIEDLWAALGGAIGDFVDGAVEFVADVVEDVVDVVVDVVDNTVEAVGNFFGNIFGRKLQDTTLRVLREAQERGETLHIRDVARAVLKHHGKLEHLPEVLRRLQRPLERMLSERMAGVLRHKAHAATARARDHISAGGERRLLVHRNGEYTFDDFILIDEFKLWALFEFEHSTTLSMANLRSTSGDLCDLMPCLTLDVNKQVPVFTLISISFRASIITKIPYVFTAYTFEEFTVKFTIRLTDIFISLNLANGQIQMGFGSIKGSGLECFGAAQGQGQVDVDIEIIGAIGVCAASFCFGLEISGSGGSALGFDFVAAFPNSFDALPPKLFDEYEAAADGFHTYTDYQRGKIQDCYAEAVETEQIIVTGGVWGFTRWPSMYLFLVLPEEFDMLTQAIGAKGGKVPVFGFNNKKARIEVLGQPFLYIEDVLPFVGKSMFSITYFTMCILIPDPSFDMADALGIPESFGGLTLPSFWDLVYGTGSVELDLPGFGRKMHRALLQLEPEEEEEANIGRAGAHRFEGDGFPLSGWWPAPRSARRGGSGHQRRGERELLVVDYGRWRDSDCAANGDYKDMCFKCEGVSDEALLMAGGTRGYEAIGERCVGPVALGRFRRERRLPGAIALSVGSGLWCADGGSDGVSCTRAHDLYPPCGPSCFHRSYKEIGQNTSVITLSRLEGDGAYCAPSETEPVKCTSVLDEGDATRFEVVELDTFYDPRYAGYPAGVLLRKPGSDKLCIPRASGEVVCSERDAVRESVFVLEQVGRSQYEVVLKHAATGRYCFLDDAAGGHLMCTSKTAYVGDERLELIDLGDGAVHLASSGLERYCRVRSDYSLACDADAPVQFDIAQNADGTIGLAQNGAFCAQDDARADGLLYCKLARPFLDLRAVPCDTTAPAQRWSIDPVGGLLTNGDRRCVRCPATGRDLFAPPSIAAIASGGTPVTAGSVVLEMRSCGVAHYWAYTMDGEGWSYTPSQTHALTGLYRSTYADDLRGLDAAFHCDVNVDAGDVECADESIGLVFDFAGWALCPTGTWMHGMYRSSDHGLNALESLSCCGMRQRSARRWGKCVDVDIGRVWDDQANVLCPAGMALVGMYRSSANGLSGIESLRCCEVAGTPSGAIASIPVSILRPWEQVFRDWEIGFDSRGWQGCGKINRGIAGIYVNQATSGLSTVRGVPCRALNAEESGILCQTLDISLSFDTEGWANCPQGTYVEGMYRADCDEIFCLERLSCCGSRVAAEAARWGRCEDVNVRLNASSAHECPGGMVLTGMYRAGASNILEDITVLRCCEARGRAIVAKPTVVLSAAFTQQTELRLAINAWSYCFGDGGLKAVAFAGLARDGNNELDGFSGTACMALNTPEDSLSCYSMPRGEDMFNGGYSWRWASCDAGGYINGIYRSDGLYLWNIEDLRCCGMAADAQPAEWGECTELDVSATFDAPTTQTCPEGMALVAIQLSTYDDGGRLYHIERLKCCEIVGVLGLSELVPGRVLALSAWPNTTDFTSTIAAIGDPPGHQWVHCLDSSAIGAAMVGLVRAQSYSLDGLVGAECAVVHTPDTELDCVQEFSVNGALEASGDPQWAICPEGRYMNGIEFHGDCSTAVVDRPLNCIESFRCCGARRKVQRVGGACVDVDISTAFDNAGTVSCPEGMALRGVYRSPYERGYLYHVEKLRCCEVFGVASPAAAGKYLPGELVAITGGSRVEWSTALYNAGTRGCSVETAAMTGLIRLNAPRRDATWDMADACEAKGYGFFRESCPTGYLRSYYMYSSRRYPTGTTAFYVEMEGLKLTPMPMEDGLADAPSLPEAVYQNLTLAEAGCRARDDCRALRFKNGTGYTLMSHTCQTRCVKSPDWYRLTKGGTLAGGRRRLRSRRLAELPASSTCGADQCMSSLKIGAGSFIDGLLELTCANGTVIDLTGGQSIGGSPCSIGLSSDASISVMKKGGGYDNHLGRVVSGGDACGLPEADADIYTERICTCASGCLTGVDLDSVGASPAWSGGPSLLTSFDLLCSDGSVAECEYNRPPYYDDVQEYIVNVPPPQEKTTSPYYYLSGAQCSSVATPAEGVECVDAEFDERGTAGAWRLCPEGRYMNGITSLGSSGYLEKLYSGKCCGAAKEYQRGWGACVDVDVSDSFEDGGSDKCPSGMALVGFYVSDIQYLEGLDTLRCCQIVAAPAVGALATRTVGTGDAGVIRSSTYVVARGDRLMEGAVLLSPAKQYQLAVEGGGQLVGVSAAGAIIFHSEARLAGGRDCWLELGEGDGAAVATYCEYGDNERVLVWQLTSVDGSGDDVPVVCSGDQLAELTVTRTGRIVLTCGGGVLFTSPRPPSFPACDALVSCGACVTAQGAGGEPRCAWRNLGFHGLSRCADAVVADDPLLTDSDDGATVAAGDASACAVRSPVAYSGSLAAADRLFPGDTLTSANGAYVVDFDASGSLMARAAGSDVPFWRANTGASGAFGDGCYARVIDRAGLATANAVGIGFLRAGVSLQAGERILSDAGYFAMELLPNGDVGVRHLASGELTWSAGGYGAGGCTVDVASDDGSVRLGCSRGASWTTGATCANGAVARFGPSDVGGALHLCDGEAVWSGPASMPSASPQLSALEIVCPGGELDWTSASAASDFKGNAVGAAPAGGGAVRLAISDNRSVAVLGGESGGGPAYRTTRTSCSGAVSCEECVGFDTAATCAWSPIGFASTGGARCASYGALNLTERVDAMQTCTAQTAKIQSPLGYYDKLYPGDELRSPNLLYFATISRRGELVVQDDDGIVYWSSGISSDSFEGCMLTAIGTWPVPGATFVIKDVELAYDADVAAEADVDEGGTNIADVVAAAAATYESEGEDEDAGTEIDASEFSGHSALAVQCSGGVTAYKTVGTAPCYYHQTRIVLDNNGQLKLECANDPTLPSLTVARPAHVCADARSCGVCTDPNFHPTGLKEDDGCVWSRVGFDSGVSCMARSQVALAGASALVASTCGSVESRSVYDRLEADDALFVGDALVSSSTGERLEVLASGQLALRDVDGAALWTSPPASAPAHLLDDCSLRVDDVLGGAIVACKVRGVPSRIFVTYNDGTRRAGAADEGAVRASLAVADGRVELKRAANSESLWSAPGCSSRASTCEMCTGAADGLCAWRAAGFASAAHGLGGERCVSAAAAIEAGLLDEADSVQRADCPVGARVLGDALESGDTLRAGDRIVSEGGAYALEMRADGELLGLELSGGGAGGDAIFWRSGTDGRIGEQCVAAMESDGLRIRCGVWPDVQSNNGDLGVRMVEVWAAPLACDLEFEGAPRVEVTLERQLQPFCGSLRREPADWVIGSTLPSTCAQLPTCAACTGAAAGGSACVWRRDSWGLTSRCASTFDVDAAEGVSDVGDCAEPSHRDIEGGLNAGDAMHAGDRLWSSDGEYYLEVLPGGVIELRALRTARVIARRRPQLPPPPGDDCFLVVAEHGVWNMACGSPLYAIWTNKDMTARVMPSALCDPDVELARLVVTERHELEVHCVARADGSPRASYGAGYGFTECRDIIDCEACAQRPECDWNADYWPWTFSGWPFDEGGERARCENSTDYTKAYVADFGQTCTGYSEAAALPSVETTAAALSTMYYGELSSGALQAGETILSPKARFVFGLRPDGNLVFATVGGAIFWQSFTAGISDEPCVFQLEPAGNVTSSFSIVCGGEALWVFPQYQEFTQTSPCTGDGVKHTLAVTDNRELQLRCGYETVGDARTLLPGNTDVLQPGQWGDFGAFAMYSADMAFEVVFDEDGDLRLFDRDAGTDVWKAGATGDGCMAGMALGEGMPKIVCPTGGADCGLETVRVTADQVEVRASGPENVCGVKTVWSTGRTCANDEDARLSLQDDRNLVHYCGGTVLWETGTYKAFRSEGICEVLDSRSCDASDPDLQFDQEYQGDSKTVWRVKHKATGMCVWCPPFSLDELAENTWVYSPLQRLGEASCQLVSCDLPLAQMGEGMWYRQRESAWQHLDTGGPGGVCDANNVPLDDDNCEAYPKMCAVYHDAVYKCERTKRDFIDEKLKPLFVKFAQFVALLQEKADQLSDSAAAVADTKIAAREKELASLQAQIAQRKAKTEKVSKWLAAKYDLCMYYGYPSGHQLHAEMRLTAGFGGVLSSLGKVDVFDLMAAAFWPVDQTEEDGAPPPSRHRWTTPGAPFCLACGVR